MTDKNVTEKLNALLKRASERDESLRAEFSIGDKFRFVREKLKALSALIHEEVTATAAEVVAEKVITQDEMCVYVHLFNAQGLNLLSWEKLLHPSVFYEHGVNRPIYSNLNDVQAFLRAAKVKVQHGFLEVLIRQSSVLPVKEEAVTKDAYGHVLLKVREGALKFDRCVGFLHNEVEYTISADGKLVSITS